MNKKTALVITVILSLAFAWPGLGHVLPAAWQAEDSFPISTFPMFSVERPELHRMTWVRALDSEKKEIGHIPTGVFNPGGMNQAMQHLRKARWSKGKKRRAMCREIAERVARKRSLRKVARIQIVDAYYRPEKVFGKERDDTPERQRTLVSCEVERESKKSKKQDRNHEREGKR